MRTHWEVIMFVIGLLANFTKKICDMLFKRDSSLGMSIVKLEFKRTLEMLYAFLRKNLQRSVLHALTYLGNGVSIGLWRFFHAYRTILCWSATNSRLIVFDPQNRVPFLNRQSQRNNSST